LPSGSFLLARDGQASGQAEETGDDVNATDTLDTLKSGTTQLAGTTSQAVAELAGTAKEKATTVIGDVAERIVQHPAFQQQKPKRRKGRMVLGLALGGAAVGWLVKLARGTSLGQAAEERLTGGRANEPVVDPLGTETLAGGGTTAP
jgi:hypothetical protein